MLHRNRCTRESFHMAEGSFDTSKAREVSPTCGSFLIHVERAAMAIAVVLVVLLLPILSPSMRLFTIADSAAQPSQLQSRICQL